MQGRHFRCQIDGCPLSKRHYFRQLSETAVQAFKANVADLRVSMRKNCHPVSPFPLNDFRLHDNMEISLNSNCVDDIFLLYGKFTRYFDLKIDNRSFTLEDLQIQLWCSLVIQNYPSFKKTLEAGSKIIPTCILSSLLLRAIEYRSVEGVEILLKNGVSPDLCLSSQPNNRPLVMLLQQAEDNAIDSYHWPPGEITKVSHIFNLLISHGASLKEPVDRHSGTNALHKLSYYALHSPALANAIIETAPSICFAALASGFPFQTGFTPLANALRDLAWLDLHYIPSDRSLLQVSACSILSLLRGGSPMTPDPFEYPDACFFNFMANLVKDEFQAIFELVICARQKGSLQVGKLTNLTDETPCFDYNNEFIKIVKDKYPLKLDTLCRISILKQMPRGVNFRINAIKSLGLPTCLSNYLCFDDLEDKLRLVSQRCN